VEAQFAKPSPYAKSLRFGTGNSRNLLTSSLRTIHTALSKKRFKATRPGETEPISRFLKLDPHGVCNTIRAGTASDRGAFTSPRPIHPFSPRCITVREAARLHSYPDWFRFHVTKWHGFRQVGNSVPPLLGQAVASKIMERLGQKTESDEPRVLGDPILLGFNMSEAAEHYGVAANVIPHRIRRGDVEKAHA
jgi:DNA (cytosine-5)-methyltransferase 1